MRLVAYILAGVVSLLGLILIVGWQGQVSRILIGCLLLGTAAVIVYLTQIQPKTSTTTTIQQIDLSGDVNLEEIRCNSCNAPLSKDDIDVEAGAIFVHCAHCGATYQFEEEPKW